jgi:tetratricopeptide (TPR) repeat protein
LGPATGNNKWSIPAVCTGLAVITGLSFLPVLNNSFIMFDDGLYVADNPRVLKGLKWTNILWAFGSFRASNWHPITWLSHMLDCQLYGTAWSGHHLSNLLLHIVNTLMLFVVLARFTGARGPSAIAAAIFGVHPVHVESVAWIAERKDLLSSFFFLLTLIAYGNYTSSAKEQLQNVATTKSPIQRQLIWYALSLCLFACGLMSKPMLVTLPFVLLLLDLWPLARMGHGTSYSKRKVGVLLLEKIPFFGLAAVSCAVTMAAQSASGAVVSLQRLSINLRIENACVSFLRYAGKMIWPTHLAVFYPHRPAPLWVFLIAILFIIGGCVAAFYFRRRRGWLFTGWFWFLGMLVPVSGLVQVGSQAMADRYLYLPSIGLLVALVWELNEAVRFWPQYKSAIGFAGSLIVVALIAVTFIQSRRWKNTETLFTYTRQVTDKNYLACTLLARAIGEEGRTSEATALLEEALQFAPDYAPARVAHGDLLAKQNQHALAVADYEAGLQLDPNNADTHNNLANSLEFLGRHDEALQHYHAALELNPDFALAQYNFALALARSDRQNEAEAHYRAAINLNRGNTSAHYNLAEVLVHLGRLDDAKTEYQTALRLNPKHFGAQMNLASTLVAQGDNAGAIPHFRAALKLRPDFADGHLALARALIEQGNGREALSHLYEAVRLQPDSVPALLEISWILATNPRPELRNGSEAIHLAENACERAGANQAEPLKCLAAAYAESGRFEEAVSAAEKALTAARTSQQTELAQSLENQLQLYRSHKPFHEAHK